MCDPITIAGIALTGASTVANSIGASKAASARDDALAAERIRQNGYDNQAAAVNQHSQDLYKDFGTDEAAKSSELGDYFAGQKAGAANTDVNAVQAQVAPQTGSPLVIQEDAKQQAKADAYSNQQGQALGKLRAFGDVLGTDSRLQARDAGTIGQIGSFKAGSSGVLPLELDAASQAGQGAKTFGDILGLGGQLLTAKGLQGTTLKPSTLSDVIGYNPAGAVTSPTYFPSAPKKGLYNLFGN